MKKAIERCTTLRWHRPLCSDCGEPIISIRDAYAAWLVDDDDDDGRFLQPEVIHSGGRCGHARRELRGTLPAGFGVNDLPVEWLRRSPLEAVSIAMRGEPEQRSAWLEWVAVVLGLPANAWDSIAMLQAHGEVADVPITRVRRSS